MEGVARILSDAVEKGKDAKTVLGENRRMPGLGHPIHKPVDPRSVRLFEIARETGFHGKYCKLMEAIAKEKNITLNATGAIGALACELGLDWKIVKGLGVMARAIGLVGHILEETREPMATEIWDRVEEEATRHLRK
jgi:citrate synthase